MSITSVFLHSAICLILVTGCNARNSGGNVGRGQAMFAENVRFVNQSLTLDNRLKVPPLLEPKLQNGEKVFDLSIQTGITAFFKEQQTQTYGFNGSYLGPTIRARLGDKVRVNITNHLNENTAVHWHGMHVPAAMDGGPHQMIAPQGMWQPNWTIGNEAATLWYHSHMMEATAQQVYRGLAGLFIIDDANTDTLDLPKAYGVDDVPLVVQDREFDNNGQLVYRHDPSRKTLTAGMLGEVILVNGTYAPFADVPAKLLRLRLLNGSNARRYQFGFADNRSFRQIASDGGLLPAAVERTRLLLAPGERAEILVDLSNDTTPVTLMSYSVLDPAKAAARAAQAAVVGGSDEGQQFKILELRPQKGNYRQHAVTQMLNRVSPIDEKAANKTRQFALAAFTINDKMIDHVKADFAIKKGDIEIWEIHNNSPTFHPFHIHHVQFQLISRDGKPPMAYEAGWKDTIIVNQAEKVRLKMQFKDFADLNLPYMYHCHILEHEDMGMMGQFVIVNDLREQVLIKSPLTESPNLHKH